MNTDGLIYAFDLDGTLCETDGMDYMDATPIRARIAVVNTLHARGHTILIHTARGNSLGVNARRRLLENTRRQLSEWEVRYHRLVAKPFAHVYVDDRGAHPDEFFAEVARPRAILGHDTGEV